MASNVPFFKKLALVEGESWASPAGTPTPILLKDTHIAPSLWDQTELSCELPLPLGMGSTAGHSGWGEEAGVGGTSEESWHATGLILPSRPLLGAAPCG